MVGSLAGQGDLGKPFATWLPWDREAHSKAYSKILVFAKC